MTKMSFIGSGMNGSSLAWMILSQKLLPVLLIRGYVGGSAIIASPGYIRRTYKDLVLHNILYITLEFVITGNWQPSDWFSVDVDGVSSVRWSLASKITPSSGVTCGAGTSSPGFNGFIIGRVFHKASSVTVTINFSVAQVGSSSNGPTVGVRDVTVLQKYAQNGDSQGFYITTSDSTIISNTGCNKGNFPTGNIMAPCQVCPSSICGVCIGLGGNDCMKSKLTGSFYSTGFSNCMSGCMFCTGPSASDCVQCTISYTLDTGQYL